MWSTSGRFPSSRLNRDGGRQNLDELVLLPEAHTSSRTIVPPEFPADWPVWACSVPFDHPEYMNRYAIESTQPVTSDVAGRKVAEQLNSTADVIDSFILPWFAKVEQQHSSRRCESA